MIGRLRGILAQKQPPDILVDVAGVGYELQVPMSTLFQLPDTGSEVTLVTHFVVREDAQQLYGFIRERDRTLFRQLIRVNGVGPKLALAILSGMDADSFVRCVQREDVKALVALPGVGRRTAERLLLDMRSKLEEWVVPLEGADPLQTAREAVAGDASADAESALIALGYKPQEASRAVAAVNDQDGVGSEELIRRALRSMVSSS